MVVIMINHLVSNNLNIFQGNDPFNLIKTHGSPLYVYNERVIRENCKKIKNFVTYPNFSVHYSAKANSNVAILQIIKEEGLNVDAMSPGEIFAEMQAGFMPNEILFVSNNVPTEGMQYAIERNILMSVDSISQLEQYGKLAPNSRVVLRFNPGIGDGHSVKTITAGQHTKFGIQITNQNIQTINDICSQHNLIVVGLHMHIGSLFFDITNFLESGYSLLSVARNFPSIEFIDLGGGFGIPYKKQEGQKSIDLIKVGQKLDEFMFTFSKKIGKNIQFKIEPGRFIVAESGIILGSVISTKQNYETKYIGCDIGFNSLLRPTMYNAHHDIEVFPKDMTKRPLEVVTVVGNICENSDNLATNRMLPKMNEGDIICVLDAGAYGYSMASNYNNMLRPAEVLIRRNNEVVLIRKRETLEDLTMNVMKL